MSSSTLVYGYDVEGNEVGPVQCACCSRPATSLAADTPLCDECRQS